MRFIILNLYCKALFAVLTAGVSLSCAPEKKMPATNLSQEVIIPKPVSVTATNSAFELTTEAGIHIQGASEALRKNAQYLADKLKPATGFELAVEGSEGEAEEGHIYLSTGANDDQLGEEGYELNITEEAISLNANTEEGIFRGMQTLFQLLPASIEMGSVQQGPWYIPSGTIRDYPEYGYRGVMLDVARHFFAPEDVKQYLDYIAYYKMNAMHLHLSDDQGWRIEIKSWPKLTETGGSTEVGGGEGGFYTQEEYAEIVAYAADRYITIVPEIDMPGHTNAALSSYPELNCDNKARELYTGIEVGFSTLCTDKEVVYEFIDDVVGELAALTPGPYIHIGGDESHVTPMEDYIPFINRAQGIVKSHGKQVMGWDEIANAELVDNAVVQYWAEAENAQKAVAQGAKVLMSPATKAYMDMQYDSTTQLGLHWAAYIEVDSAYIWNPAELAEGIEKEQIIGIEAPLWTETITNLDELEYMVFPRLPGYAEIGWTASGERNWDEYKERLAAQKDRFEAMNINYYPSPFVPWK
ncbi:beta-N-acetylhexosaminidase [Catalinimonas alkaloidigena]|uniref:beta-N-acetylhexosaminidase n=1 Tax=Catalinimonas alkaloidigena TaxID=1075417 RepID=UPI0024059EAF|nr:beta-N-acetylhexosaminidase [Catalinimonas alkaloidigena]